MFRNQVFENADLYEKEKKNVFIVYHSILFFLKNVFIKVFSGKF